MTTHLTTIITFLPKWHPYLLEEVPLRLAEGEAACEEAEASLNPLVPFVLVEKPWLAAPEEE